MTKYIYHSLANQKADRARSEMTGLFAVDCLGSHVSLISHSCDLRRVKPEHKVKGTELDSHVEKPDPGMVTSRMLKNYEISGEGQMIKA